MAVRIEGFDGPIGPSGDAGLTHSLYKLTGWYGLNAHTPGDVVVGYFPTEGRNGGGCIGLKCNSATSWGTTTARGLVLDKFFPGDLATKKIFHPSVQGYSIGFAWKTKTALPTSYLVPFFTMANPLNNTMHGLTLEYVAPNWVISYRASSTTRVGSGNFPGGDSGGAPQANRWYYIEMQLNPNGAGQNNLTIRVDGVVIGTSTLAPSNGSLSGTAEGHIIVLGRSPTVSSPNYWNTTDSREHYFDDIYIETYPYTAPAALWGDTRVLYRPASADGYHLDFAPSMGVDRYAMVDDPSGSAYDGDSTYVSAGDMGDKVSFRFAEPVTLPATIKAVQPSVVLSRASDESRIVRLFGRVGGTDYQTPATADYQMSPPASYVGLWDGDTYKNNPATGLPWTNDDLRDAEFGLKLET